MGSGRYILCSSSNPGSAGCNRTDLRNRGDEHLAAALLDATGSLVTLRGDWTNKDARITTELAAYNRSAVPFNLIWLPGKTAPVILPELLTPSTVLDALKKNG